MRPAQKLTVHHFPAAVHDLVARRVREWPYTSVGTERVVERRRGEQEVW